MPAAELLVPVPADPSLASIRHTRPRLLAFRWMVCATMLLQAACQTTEDPFPDPIGAAHDPIHVGLVEFARIPDRGGKAPRLMTLVTEPQTQRIFVSDMDGAIYSSTYDGGTVTEYLDLTEARWRLDLLSEGAERGVQSFAFHPQFAAEGAPGRGKFYTWIDTSNKEPEADFVPVGRSSPFFRGAPAGDTGDTVLLEWTAADPLAPTYDGGPPRELLRIQQPFGNHNGGHIAFKPAPPNDSESGMLFVGVADGGSASDPLGLAQNLGAIYGKILRIDPLGSNSVNGRYGIPETNPFAGDGDDSTLGEIYAFGVRNPQRFTWDAEDGSMYLADIGQNLVEEVSRVVPGANLGWNEWEGSFKFVSNVGLSLVEKSVVSPRKPRRDSKIMYPVAEYDHTDPLLQLGAAVAGVHVFRDGSIPMLEDMLLFGDMPSGEVFAVPADQTDWGQAPIRRVLFEDEGELKTLLQLIQEKNAQQGREPALRADMRFGFGPEGKLFLINKSDGVLRFLIPGSTGE